jgi:hypothetical protein
VPDDPLVPPEITISAAPVPPLITVPPEIVIPVTEVTVVTPSETDKFPPDEAVLKILHLALLLVTPLTPSIVDPVHASIKF